jgi:hypothetical protein
VSDHDPLSGDPFLKAPLSKVVAPTTRLPPEQQKMPTMISV